MSKVKNILKGWGRKVKDKFNTLEPEIKEMSEKRLKICDPCPVRYGNTCSSKREGFHKDTNELTKGCGCFVDAKSMVEDEKCPLNKW